MTPTASTLTSRRSSVASWSSISSHVVAEAGDSADLVEHADLYAELGVVMDNSVLGDPDALASEIAAAGTGEDDGVAAELLRILEEKEEQREREAAPSDSAEKVPEAQEHREHRSPSSSQRRQRGDHHHRGRHHKRRETASPTAAAAPDPAAPPVVSAEQQLLLRPFASPLVSDPRRRRRAADGDDGDGDATTYATNIRQHAVPRSLLTIPASTLPLKDIIPTAAWAEFRIT
jgi:hypothetical protein